MVQLMFCEVGPVRSGHLLNYKLILLRVGQDWAIDMGAVQNWLGPITGEWVGGK